MFVAGALAQKRALHYNSTAELRTITGDYMRLPATVQELADVIGTQRALFLIGQLPKCVSRKSTHVILYVPTLARLTPDHRLVQILGWHDAAKLCQAFGGEILQPANCAQLYRSFRDKSIYRLVTEQGLKLSEVAEMFNMTERHVRNVLREISQQEKPAANDNDSARIHLKGARF